MGCLSDFGLPQFQIDQNKTENRGSTYFEYAGYQISGLNVYVGKNTIHLHDIYVTDNIICPICHKVFSHLDVLNLRAKRVPDFASVVTKYKEIANYSKEIDIFDQLDELGKQMDAERYYYENYVHKYRCTKTGTEIYIRIYGEYPTPYLENPKLHYDNWKNNPQMRQQLLEERKIYITELKRKEEEEKRKEQNESNSQRSSNNNESNDAETYGYPAYLCHDCGFGAKGDNCCICGKWCGTTKYPANICDGCGFGGKVDNCCVCGKWCGGTKYPAYLCGDCGFGGKDKNCCKCGAWCT